MFDQTAEKAIIKAMMTGHMTEIIDTVPFELFQTKDAQETVKTMYSMESVTFNTMLQARRFNSDYIYECYSMQCEANDIPYYAERLKLAFTKKLANEFIRDVNKMMNSPECLLEELSRKLSNGVEIDLVVREAQKIVMPETYADEHLLHITEQATNPAVRQGIRIKSLPQLDSTFYGLQGGDLILVCAQSGHGKTAFALNLVDDLSVDQRYTGYYGNAEMRLEELTGRIVSKRANIPTSEVLSGQFQEVEKSTALRLIAEQYEHMKHSGLILSRIPIMSVNTLKHAYQKLEKMGRKPDYILVDYLGRMEPARDTKGLQEWQILYLIAEELKTLAVELDVPIIALAQLNEEGRIEGAKKVKNACDGVLFFEPITEEDEKKLNDFQRSRVNYRIEKYKVRRNDNSKPIYIGFKKKYQSITEVF